MEKLFVIDDDQSICDMICDIFTGSMVVNYALDCTAEAIESLIEFEPAVILLDINLPSAKGFSITDDILFELPNVKIIFFSGLATQDEKLQAFASGAFDYLDKPFDIDILGAKVEVAIKATLQESEHSQKISNIRSSMFEAMTQAAELGSLLRFTDEATQCNSLEELAEKFFALLGEMELNTSLRISLNDKNHQVFFNDDIERPLESEILISARQSGRLVDFGSRTMVNEAHCSILIRNMPIDDEIRYGMIRDNICFVITAIESKIQQLSLLKKLKAKEKHFLITSQVLKDIIQELEKNSLEFTADSTRLLNDLSSDMQCEFTSLSITEDEEARIINTLTNCSDNIHKLFTENKEKDQKIHKILQELLNIYKKSEDNSD